MITELEIVLSLRHENGRSLLQGFDCKSGRKFAHGSHPIQDHAVLPTPRGPPLLSLAAGFRSSFENSIGRAGKHGHRMPLDPGPMSTTMKGNRVHLATACLQKS
ncbi:hypothetical protein L218DRAFT_711338 [Marasmius fiardii PR-910]|nr:hypothetical protein L218DRAFT_711338 [Marasmius fiardii PR-910]